MVSDSSPLGDLPSQSWDCYPLVTSSSPLETYSTDLGSSIGSILELLSNGH